MPEKTAGYYVGTISGDLYKKEIPVYILNGNLITTSLGSWLFNAFYDNNEFYLVPYYQKVIRGKDEITPSFKVMVTIAQSGMFWEIADERLPLRALSSAESEALLRKIRWMAEGLSPNQQLDLLESVGLVHEVEFN